MQFVRRLVRHDVTHIIYECLWNKYSGPVRLLIQNQFVYGPFWKFQQQSTHMLETLAEGEWRAHFDRDVRYARAYLQSENVHALLGVVLDRLYVLRNQLMHGGATYRGRVNRKQVRDGANLLTTLMPGIIRIMLAAPEEDWGVISWPVIKS